MVLRGGARAAQVAVALATGSAHSDRDSRGPRRSAAPSGARDGQESHRRGAHVRQLLAPRGHRRRRSPALRSAPAWFACASRRHDGAPHAGSAPDGRRKDRLRSALARSGRNTSCTHSINIPRAAVGRCGEAPLDGVRGGAKSDNPQVRTRRSGDRPFTHALSTSPRPPCQIAYCDRRRRVSSGVGTPMRAILVALTFPALDGPASRFVDGERTPTTVGAARVLSNVGGHERRAPGPPIADEPRRGSPASIALP